MQKFLDILNIWRPRPRDIGESLVVADSAAVINPDVLLQIQSEIQNGIITNPAESIFRTLLYEKYGLIFQAATTYDQAESQPVIKSSNTHPPQSRMDFLMRNHIHDSIYEYAPGTHRTDYLLTLDDRQIKVWRYGDNFYGDIKQQRLSGVGLIKTMDVPVEDVDSVFRGAARTLPTGGVLGWQRNFRDCSNDIFKAIDIGLVPIEYALDENGEIRAVNFVKPDTTEGKIDLLPDIKKHISQLAEAVHPIVLNILNSDQKFNKYIAPEDLVSNNILLFSFNTPKGKLYFDLSIVDRFHAGVHKPSNFIPNISQIQIPSALRRTGHGRALISTVEECLRMQGYPMLTATNLTPDGKLFWKDKKLGYIDGRTYFGVDKENYIVYKSLR